MKANFGTKNFRSTFSLIALLLGVALMSSCAKSDGTSAVKPDTTVLVTPPVDGNNTGSEGSANANASAYVMAINASEIALPQDLWVDNSSASTLSLGYKQATPYVAVKPGSHQIQFNTASTSQANSAVTLNISGSNYYSFFYTEDKTIVVAHDDHVMPAQGKARVRLINLSTYLNSKVDMGVGVGDSRILSGLNAKTPSAFYNVDAGSTFSIYKIGSGTIQLSVTGTIEARHIYTIVVTGTTQATLAYTLLSQD